MDEPAQFRLPDTGAAYVSTFAGDGFDWTTVRNQIDFPLYVVPNWQANEVNVQGQAVDGLFSWLAWPSQNNGPVDREMSTENDENYLKVTDETEKVYMAPVSPWCE